MSFCLTSVSDDSLFYAAEHGDSCFVKPLQRKGTTFFSYMQICKVDFVISPQNRIKYNFFCLISCICQTFVVPLHAFSSEEQNLPICGRRLERRSDASGPIAQLVSST